MKDGFSTSSGAAQRLGALTDALQSAALPACVRDAGGRYVAVNAEFADLVGLEASRLVGKTDNALQPADVAHRVAELDALVLDAHGHLDARETVLARDGRRTMRACRFPIYDGDEAWAICVVMAPGDDLQSGRLERERLQGAAGQGTTIGLSAPAEELLAEREARAAADAEAMAAREALAVEREARLEAQIEAERVGRERDEVAEQAAAALEAAQERVAHLDRDLAASTARRDELDAALAVLRDGQAGAEDEIAEVTARRDALEAELATVRAARDDVEQRARDGEEELEWVRAQLAEVGAAAEAEGEIRAHLEAAMAHRDAIATELAVLRGAHDDLQRLLEETAASRDGLAAELHGLRERHDLAARELEQERGRAEWLGGELAAAHDSTRDAHGQVTASEARREELERALHAANEQTEALRVDLEVQRERASHTVQAGDDATAQELADERESRRAAELERDRTLDAHARTREALDHHRAVAHETRARLAALEAQAAQLDADAADTQAAHDLSVELALELTELRARAERAEADRADLEAELADAQQQPPVIDDDLIARTDQALARAAAAEFAHADVQQSLRVAQQRAEHTETLRSDLTVALAAHAELEEALTAEREARALAERRLTDALTAAAQAPAVAAPTLMTSPYTGRPSLPPLAVAAEQARAFAYSAPIDVDDGPPPGFTPEGLEELDRAFEKSSSPRAAGRAALQALATATGWTGGALWTPREDGDFACSETWSAYMSGLEAWETMAWRAHLEDGLVPAAAGSGEAHWADTEEMLACPRSRSAAWADLGTLATVPVVHPDGRVLAVLELVRAARDVADPELLAALSGVSVRLAERLATIEEELTAQAGRL